MWDRKGGHWDSSLAVLCQHFLILFSVEHPVGGRDWGVASGPELWSSQARMENLKACLLTSGYWLSVSVMLISLFPKTVRPLTKEPFITRASDSLSLSVFVTGLLWPTAVSYSISYQLAMTWWLQAPWFVIVPYFLDTLVLTTKLLLSGTDPWDIEYAK